jgi:hypothetical protein
MLHAESHEGGEGAVVLGDGAFHLQRSKESQAPGALGWKNRGLLKKRKNM